MTEGNNSGNSFATLGLVSVVAIVGVVGLVVLLTGGNTQTVPAQAVQPNSGGDVAPPSSPSGSNTAGQSILGTCPGSKHLSFSHCMYAQKNVKGNTGQGATMECASQCTTRAAQGQS